MSQQQPKPPIASIRIDVGDRNENGITDLSTTLTIAGRDLGPVTIDVPQAQAISLLTGIFDGAGRGAIGMATAAVGAILPHIFGEKPMPAWLRSTLSVVESVAGGDHGPKA